MNGKLRNMTSIYLMKDDRVLLLYRQGGSVVNNVWTGSAGGHFEEFELNDARACVLREMNEETGLTENNISELKLKYITLRNTKGEIRQNYYFFAQLNEETAVSSNEGILKWFSLCEIGDLDMPFTAKYVMQHYLSEGMMNEKIYGGITSKDGVVFTELEAF